MRIRSMNKAKGNRRNSRRQPFIFLPEGHQYSVEHQSSAEQLLGKGARKEPAKPDQNVWAWKFNAVHSNQGQLPLDEKDAGHHHRAYEDSHQHVSSRSPV